MATLNVASATYTAIFLLYVFTLGYDWIHVEIGHKEYAGKFKFLTFWNLCLQTFYFGLCVLHTITSSDEADVLGPKHRSRLHKMCDIIHATLAFPVGMFVVATFWVLYAVDRELVYPKALDALIPSWLNHVMHTTVLPLLLVEKYLVYHHHPSRHNGIFILTAFAVTYLVWILWIAYAADLWVYPVLRVMQTHERVIFIAFLLMFFISIYLLGEAVTNFLWRKKRAALLGAATKRK